MNEMNHKRYSETSIRHSPARRSLKGEGGAFGTLSATAHRATADRHSSGFTLVELMMVIAIIGVLAGMILGFSGYAARKADRSRAIAGLEQLKNALEEYRLEYGSYPSLSGALTNSGFSTLRIRLSNAVPDVVFEDPWGNGYLYQNEGTYHFRLWSLGPDSSEEADGDDIRAESGQQ